MNDPTHRDARPAGQPIVAQTVRTAGKAGATGAMVIVTARVVGETPTASGTHLRQIPGMPQRNQVV